MPHTRGLKRPSDDPDTTFSKKAKLAALTETLRELEAAMQALKDAAKEEEDDDEDEEEEDAEGISLDVQSRLDHMDSMLDMLSKDYLKAIMKELPQYRGRRGGTNKQMVAEIKSHLEQLARDQADLAQEETIVEKVHRSCYRGWYEDEEGLYEDEADEGDRGV